jgi:hypothetical protein
MVTIMGDLRIDDRADLHVDAASIARTIFACFAPDTIVVEGSGGTMEIAQPAHCAHRQANVCQQALQLLEGGNDMSQQDARSADIVSDRKDFYFKVKSAVASEPPQGQEALDSQAGPHVWEYGFSTYPESPAVVISSVKYDYAEPWQIGWRESTLEFGPDPSKLIVGWRVQANWTDGTDGSWWKASDQILLTGHGAVHVKSEYDRACDWSVIFYIVDAKDYPF